MKIQRQVEQFQIFGSTGELTGDELASSGEGSMSGHFNILDPNKEQSSILHYYDLGYKSINNHLRGKKGYENPKEANLHVSHIDSIINKAPEFTRPVLLHRGMESASNKIFGKPGEKIGKVFHDKGYVSSSANEVTASGFGNTHLHIHAGPGTKALNADSMGEPWEHEFTFPRGQRFKVLSDEVKKNKFNEKIRHIHVKALKPNEDKNLEHFSRFILSVSDETLNYLSSLPKFVTDDLAKELYAKANIKLHKGGPTNTVLGPHKTILRQVGETKRKIVPHDRVLHSTQNILDTHRIKSMIENGIPHQGQMGIWEHEGKSWISEGHHRLVAARLGGLQHLRIPHRTLEYKSYEGLT